MDLKLEGKRTLVMGCSRDIGKATARQLGRSGINVNAIHPGTAVTGKLRERLSARGSRRGVTQVAASRAGCFRV